MHAASLSVMSARSLFAFASASRPPNLRAKSNDLYQMTCVCPSCGRGITYETYDAGDMHFCPQLRCRNDSTGVVRSADSPVTSAPAQATSLRDQDSSAGRFRGADSSCGGRAFYCLCQQSKLPAGHQPVPRLCSGNARPAPLRRVLRCKSRLLFSRRPYCPPHSILPNSCHASLVVPGCGTWERGATRL